MWLTIHRFRGNACGATKIMENIAICECNDIAQYESWMIVSLPSLFVQSQMMAIVRAHSHTRAWDHPNGKCSKRCHWIKVNRPVNVQQLFASVQLWSRCARQLPTANCWSLTLFNFVFQFELLSTLLFVVMKREIVRFFFVCCVQTAITATPIVVTTNYLAAVSVHFANIRLWPEPTSRPN